MDNALVIGDGFIGGPLLLYLRNKGVNAGIVGRAEFDLTETTPDCESEVIYYCAGVTKFVECEQGRESYLVNVDAPVRIARANPESLFVYLSSEAVEIALHTAYGMQKALAESQLLSLPQVAVLRLGRVSQGDLSKVCERLYRIGEKKQTGLSTWKPTVSA